MPSKKSKWREPKNVKDGFARLRREIKYINRSEVPVDLTEANKLTKWLSANTIENLPEMSAYPATEKL